MYARAEGSGGRSDEQRHPRLVRGRGASATRAVAPGIHATDSSRELVLWAPMPPSSWIRFPRFFSDVMPPRGPLELWLQHADCSAPATGAVPTSKIFIPRGWGRSHRSAVRGAPSRSTSSTTALPHSSSRSSTPRAAAWSAAPERSAKLTRAPLAATPAAVALGSPAALLSFTRLRRRVTIATCPRALAALGAEPRRPAVAAADLDGVGAGLPWPTVDDGVRHGRMWIGSRLASAFVSCEES